jgi:hypothetical protein
MIAPVATIALGLLTLAAAIDAPSDSEYTVDKPVRDIAALHRLDRQETILARRAAAGFVFVGMCHGVGFPDSMGAIQLIMGADPKVPYQAAALAMVGVYARAGFVRQEKHACAKAFEDATRPD